MMKEETEETGLDSKVLVQKAELLPLPGKRSAKPGRPESKRKPKAKKTGSSADNTSFIGQIIHGVVDGSFDAGYLLTVKVGNTDTLLRGVVFEPGLSVPISEVNDIAPNVKLTKRDKNVILSEALHTSNMMPHGQCHITMSPVPVPNDVVPSYFPTPEKIGSDRIDMGCHQQHATPRQSTSISEDISGLPSSVPVPNPLSTSSLHVQNQMEPPASKGSDQTNVEAPQLNSGPSTTAFILKADSKLSPAMVSVYGVPKSINLQSKMDFPAVIGSGKTDVVFSQPGAIPAKSTSCSQLVPVPMAIPNAVSASSTPVQTGMRFPEKTRFGQTDRLTLPDTTLSKSTSISEASSGFLSSMLKTDASAASSIHVQNQTGPPVCIGSCQTDMVTPQPSAVPLKSASTSMGVPVSSSMSNVTAQPTSSACAEKIKPPIVTGSSQTDMMLPQEDAIPSMSSFVSQAVSSLPSPMIASDSLSKLSELSQLEPSLTRSSGQPDALCFQPDAITSKSMSILQDTPVSLIPMLVQHTQATSSVCVHDQMKSPVIIGSSQTGLVLPRSHVIPPQSTSISQTVSTMPGPIPLPNAPVSSSVTVQKQKDPHAGFASGQTYSVACQSDTIPTISTSVFQTLPMLSASMPIQYAQRGSIPVQNQRGPSMRTVSGQTDIVVPLSDSISPKTISDPKNSAHSEPEGHYGPSEQVCESKVTGTQMNVDKGT